MKNILSECFNIEAGKVYSQNGKLLSEDEMKKAPGYPTFTIDNIKTNIKSNMGFIFVDQKYIETFRREFENGIIELSQEFKEKMKYDHLQIYSAFETGSEHFTTLKIKHKYDGTDCSKQTSFTKRIIYINNTFDKLDKLVGVARFLWVIYSIDQFMHDLQNIENRLIPISCQLVSVFYDTEKLINLNDGELKVSNLTFRDFNFCQNILTISSYGEINEAFLIKFAKTEDKTLKTMIEYLNLNLKKPEYLAGWNFQDFPLIICEKRKAAFEIIRHLGNANIYDSKIIPINAIDQIIYESAYNDIVIDKSNIQKNNDICINCDTPLYDDIYVVCPNKKSNIGKAVCPICLHSYFIPGTQIVASTGEKLYNSSDIITRVKYPRTVQQVIESIKVDKIVKHILLSLYQPIQKDTVDRNYITALYLNFKSPNQKKYIAWNSAIGHFISYIRNPSNEIYTKFPSRNIALEYIQSCYVFHYLNIIC